MKIEIEIPAAQMARFRKTARQLSIPASEVPQQIERWVSHKIAPDPFFWTGGYLYPNRRVASRAASGVFRAFRFKDWTARYRMKASRGHFTERVETFVNRAA